ncbi:MAG: glycosyltransferase [Rhodobacteraceae bacterium]|nr:glycosyltransferase [Paracoccaceae bacterium]
MTEGLNLLVINVFFAPHTYGGATHVAEQVSLQLARHHGCKVTAISVMSRPEFGHYCTMKTEKDGIRNYIINLPPGRTFRQIYENPSVSEQVREIVRFVEPDLVHLHCVQDIGADILQTLKGLGLPTILSVHDFWWLCERQFMIRPDGSYCCQDPIRTEDCKGCVTDIDATRRRNAFLADMAARADLVTYPSAFARDLCERSGLASGKGVVWENGVLPPRDDFFAMQSARRAQDQRLAFGFVGGPSSIKGWPLIQDAFRSLGRDDFKGYLVDASLDGSWYTSKMYRGMKGEWTVHPRYGSATIDAFYAKIDVLLFLSQWKETFGLTIREALSRGIQIIQTDGGGTIEHPGMGQVKLLQIGCPAAKLQKEVEALLEAPRSYPAPIAVRSYAAQAAQFLELAARLRIRK